MEEAKHVFTTGEVADLLHIHQTTVIDWIKKGFLKSYSTPGGHRRIERNALVGFLHEHKMPLPSELVPHVKSVERPALSEHRRPHNPPSR